MTMKKLTSLLFSAGLASASAQTYYRFSNELDLVSLQSGDLFVAGRAGGHAVGH